MSDPQQQLWKKLFSSAPVCTGTRSQIIVAWSILSLWLLPFFWHCQVQLSCIPSFNLLLYWFHLWAFHSRKYICIYLYIYHFSKCLWNSCEEILHLFITPVLTNSVNRVISLSKYYHCVIPAVWCTHLCRNGDILEKHMHVCI